MTDSNSTPQPDIWLNEYEAEGDMPCGCRLASAVDHSDDPGNEMGGEGAAFYQCPTHAAAPEMAALLRELVSGFDQAVTAAEIRAGGRQSDGVRAVAGRRVVMAAITAARPILAVIDGGQ